MFGLLPLGAGLIGFGLGTLYGASAYPPYPYPPYPSYYPPYPPYGPYPRWY